MKHGSKRERAPGLSRRAVLQGAAAVSLGAGMGAGSGAAVAKLGADQGETAEARRWRAILDRYGAEFGHIGGLE